MFGLTARRKGYGVDWYWRGAYRGTLGHAPVPYVIVRLRGDKLRIMTWYKGRLRILKSTYHANATDDALWAIVHEPLAPDVDTRLRQLTDTGKARDLSADEQAELEALLKAYNDYAMRRSEALSVLQERGYAVLDILRAQEGEG